MTRGGLFLCALLGCGARAAAQTTNMAAGEPNQLQADAAQGMLREAFQDMSNQNFDAAFQVVGNVLKLEPTNTTALNLRGSLYSMKKQYPQAQADFEQAHQSDPANANFTFNLVEIKFLEKDYDGARAGFVTLETNPDLGDLAAFKVYLCDLFGGHKAQADAELAAFDAAGSNPSYYFANVANDLVNTKDIESARGWLASASDIYSPQKFEYYSSSLRTLGYLPLPEGK